MEVKIRASAGTFELFAANVDNCFYIRDVSIYTPGTRAGCNANISIATSLFFHWTIPKRRTFACLCTEQLMSVKLNWKTGACLKHNASISAVCRGFVTWLEVGSRKHHKSTEFGLLVM